MKRSYLYCLLLILLGCQEKTSLEEQTLYQIINSHFSEYPVIRETFTLNYWEDGRTDPSTGELIPPPPPGLYGKMYINEKYLQYFTQRGLIAETDSMSILRQLIDSIPIARLDTDLLTASVISIDTLGKLLRKDKLSFFKTHPGIQRFSLPIFNAQHDRCLVLRDLAFYDHGYSELILFEKEEDNWKRIGFLTHSRWIE